MNGKCGVPVCARIASEAKWWKCPNPETEDGLYKLYERIRQANEANLVALKSQNNKLKKLQKIVGKLGSLLKKKTKTTDRLEISEVKDIPSTESKTTARKIKFNNDKLISVSASNPAPTSGAEGKETPVIQPIFESR